MIPTILLVSIVVFISIRYIPGDVIDVILSQMEYAPSHLERAELEEVMGFNVPAYVQYGRWIGNIVIRGDFGMSLYSGRPAIEEILPRIPVSFELGILGIVIGLVIAIPIGLYSGMRQDTAGDYAGRSFAIACIAFPSFWLGTLAVVFPSIWWGWSPSLNYIPITEDLLGNLVQFIIPAVILGMVMSGTAMRMIRTMTLEVLKQDYIRTAWAKGLQERVVIMRHVLKNALIPVVTIIGLQVPVLIGGAVVLEQIFSLPGMGRLLIHTLGARDYTTLSAINVIMASFVLFINLAVDITYAYLNPRIRYH